MLTVLQRPNSLVRRCARNLLYANISQFPRRPQILAGNSLQTYHYSSSAPIPRECHAWTDDEICNLVEHVKSKYRSRKLDANWKKVGEHFGIPPTACQVKYYRSHNIEFEKEDAEAAKKDGKESKFMVKAVIASAKKIASSRATWTADDVARLREARGDRNRRCDSGSWARIADYVGGGKTADQCSSKWDRLCFVEDLKALGDIQSNITAANGPTNTRANYQAWWTPEELLQLKALFDTPPVPKRPRMRIACALFPQKPQAQVRYTLTHLGIAWNVRRRKARASKSQPLLRKLVSDSGGAKKADWEAISKEIGLTALQCQRIYHEMTVAKSINKFWTPDEIDRLLTNLRSQHAHGNAYDWDLAAAAVGTRTSKQCYLRFSRDQKTSRRRLYDFGSLQ